MRTSGTFLTKDQKAYIRSLSTAEEMLDCLRKSIVENHKELLKWMKDLPLYYETETQIFVHAGVDENIPREEMDYCLIGTPEYIFTGKYPPTTGHFYKDIIAGHVAAASLADDSNFEGIYFDGESHFFIDGGTERTNRILCLAYDENEKVYYELLEDGTSQRIFPQQIQ